MAVQAHRGLPHGARASSRVPPQLGSASVFLGDPAAADHLLAAAVQQACGGNTVFSDPRSELTSSHYDTGCGFLPRKRARVGDAPPGLTMQGHRALLPPVPAPHAFAPAEDARRQGGVPCSAAAAAAAAASTSGRPAATTALSQHLCRHGAEADALVRAQGERLRAGLAEARRRHVRAAVSALERAASRRLRAAEAVLARALARNAELGERLRQVGAEGLAWRGVATGHEAAAAGLRATLDRLLQPPPPPPCAEGEAEAEAEDAGSCCFEQDPEEARGASSGNDGRPAAAACRSCGAAEARVLVLPCRHLCLCAGCEAAADACPVCAATKNASLHVLLA